MSEGPQRTRRKVAETFSATRNSCAAGLACQKANKRSKVRPGSVGKAVYALRGATYCMAANWWTPRTRLNAETE